jgi:hypothetical protein
LHRLSSPCAEQSVTKVALNVMVRAGFWVEETIDWLSRGRCHIVVLAPIAMKASLAAAAQSRTNEWGSVFKQTSTATVAVEPGAGPLLEWSV